MKAGAAACSGTADGAGARRADCTALCTLVGAETAAAAKTAAGAGTAAAADTAAAAKKRARGSPSPSHHSPQVSTGGPMPHSKPKATHATWCQPRELSQRRAKTGVKMEDCCRCRRRRCAPCSIVVPPPALGARKTARPWERMPPPSPPLPPPPPLAQAGKKDKLSLQGQDRRRLQNSGRLLPPAGARGPGGQVVHRWVGRCLGRW